MVVVPAATPPISPDAELIVATPVLPLVHVPPDTEFVSVVVAPWHIENVPPKVPGAGTTVIVRVEKLVAHELLPPYEIVTVPLDTPVTTPPAVTVAMVVLLLLHAPPDPVVVSVVVPDWQTEVAPLMVPPDGVGFTVMVRCARNVPQPSALYVILQVPEPIPCTIPVELSTLAMVLLDVVHVVV